MERRSIITTAGIVNVSVSEDGLYSLSLPGEERIVFAEVTAEDPPWLLRLQQDMQTYFAGEGVAFSCPVDYSGYTPFTLRALAAAASIPYGHLRTYRQLADQAGSPRGARAAGRAMASNRTPLVIPCHRVVQSSGKLGGFTAGTGWKERLIKLEKGKDVTDVGHALSNKR
jgi:methylated-DNA-[protein]-cysteine S-methyltransferase